MQFKTIFLSFFMLLLSFGAFAQQFDAGFKAGVSASQISGDDLAGFDKPGIFAGIFTSIDLNEKSRLTLEMNYIQKGSRKNAKPDEGIYSSYRLRLNYIEVPVMYQYFFNERLSLQMGPSFGVLLNRGDNEEDENGTVSDAKPFKNYELAMNTGMYFWFNDNFAGGIRHSVSILPVRWYEDRDSGLYNVRGRPRGHQHINMIRFFVAYKL